MAGTRKPPTGNPPKTLKATSVGGSDPTVEITLAVPGEYPEDYSEESAVWKEGYDHAARIGNPRKVCIVFANNFQGEELSDAAINAEIERLKKIQADRA